MLSKHLTFPISHKVGGGPVAISSLQFWKGKLRIEEVTAQVSIQSGF